MNICSSIDYHGIFTPISPLTNWIDRILNSNVTTTPQPLTTATTTTPSSYVFFCNRSSSCGCGYTNVLFSSSDSEKVENAATDSWSMVVSLQRSRTRDHLCTGTLLSSYFVLTTAQCAQLDPSMNISVFAGATNIPDPSGYRRTVRRVFIHPNYSSSPDFINNIAVLQLDRPLILTDNPNLNRICIDQPNNSLSVDQSLPRNGSSVVVVGWDSFRFRNTTQTTLTLEQLQLYVDNHQNNTCGINSMSASKQFCAGPLSATENGLINSLTSLIQY